MKRNKTKKAVALFLSCLLLLTAAGCGQKETDSTDGSTTVVLTTGFAKDEVFRIGTESCSKAEVLVYLTNMQNQYESIYGAEIWERKIGDKTLQEKLKDVVLSRLARIKTMNLLAQQRGTVLSEEEQQKIRAAANAYYASLSETEQQALGIDEPLIEELYGEYALANKVYAQIIENTDPEISDDEARTVTVSQIFLKTYAFDGEGNRTEYTDAAKRSEEEKIHNIKKQLTDGEDFDTLAARYNDGAQNTVSFRKGEVDAALEKAAFDLGNGEISDVIETEDGYYLLKCISTLDREQTDANKEKISQERKEEAFTNIYDEFVKTQIRKLNEDVWDQITFVDDDNVTTSQFFAMYDKYVGDMDTE